MKIASEKESWITYPINGLGSIRIQIRGKATWPEVHKELGALGLNMGIKNKQEGKQDA